MAGLYAWWAEGDWIGCGGVGPAHGRLWGWEILLTSMDQDGRQNGYDLALTAAVSARLSIPVIASGGWVPSSILYDGLVKGKADAVLAASIFHYRTHTIQQAKTYLRERGVPVRLETILQEQTR